MTFEATEEEVKQAIGIIARADADDAMTLCVHAINAAIKYAKLKAVAANLFEGDYETVQKAFKSTVHYKVGDRFQAFKRRTLGQETMTFDFVV